MVTTKWSQEMVVGGIRCMTSHLVQSPNFKKQASTRWTNWIFKKLIPAG